MASLVAPLTALPPEPLAVAQGDHGALVLAALSDGSGADVDLPVGAIATFVAVERAAEPLRHRRAPRTIAGFAIGGGDLGANVVSYAFTSADTATPGVFDWSIRIDWPTGEVYTFTGGVLEIQAMTTPQAFPVGTGMLLRCTDGGANDGKVIEACGTSDGGVFTTPKLASKFITWQVVTSGTPNAIATAWAQNTAYVAGQAVVVNGNTYVCTTAGTSNASGTGPTTTGTAIADGGGSLRWKGYAGIVFAGGFTLTDIDGSNAVQVGDADVLYGFIAANGGSADVRKADPTSVYIVAVSGTPTVAVWGWM